MITRAPIYPTELHSRRVRLSTGPLAAAEARDQVRAAIRAWDVPVDPDVAILLTSELVTNAIKHEAGETITLFITCTYGHLRVDVHDTSRFFPVLLDASGDEEFGRGLCLVDSLADKWGCDLTPDGKAVYFTLGFRPAAAPGTGGHRPRSVASPRPGMASRGRPAVTRPYGTLLRFPRKSPRCDGPQG
ncbi:MAG: ATP-binding protein [Actinobacteria bacterium]|nr:ATP-binding protein [Actinomycetota bacterium]